MSSKELNNKKALGRNSRIRNVIFAVLIVGALTLTAALSLNQSPTTKSPTVLSLEGLIDKGDYIEISNNIHQAFLNEQDEVVLLITSPGGDASESFHIYDELMYCKELYEKKLVIHAEDICASGGLLVSAAADEFYVAPHTKVGSVGAFGVLSDVHFYLTYVTQEDFSVIRSRIASETLRKFSPFSPWEIRWPFIKESLNETEKGFYEVLVKRGLNPEHIESLQAKIVEESDGYEIFMVDGVISREDFLKARGLSEHTLIRITPITFTP